MLYFVECGVIQRSVRVQVENTGDTNYPFLHGIIAADRDNGDHARVLYKSFTKEKTLSRNINSNFRDGLARYLYTRNTSRIKIIKRTPADHVYPYDSSTRIEDYNKRIIFLIFLLRYLYIYSNVEYFFVKKKKKKSKKATIFNIFSSSSAEREKRKEEKF